MLYILILILFVFRLFLKYINILYTSAMNISTKQKRKFFKRKLYKCIVPVPIAIILVTWMHPHPSLLISYALIYEVKCCNV